MHTHQQLLAAWLENSMTAGQRKEFEELCQKDSEFAQQVENARLLESVASTWQTESAPPVESMPYAANQSRSFAVSAVWHWASFAFSLAAICMVMLNVQFRFDDGTLSVSIGNHSEQKLAAQLAQYQQQQLASLQDFRSNMLQQQKLNNAELTNYLLTTGRQERREDFAEFVRFINEQRSDDQVYFAKQLTQLQEQVQYRPVSFSN